ncbi:hypothetical protein X797_000187 [Metarhizium robertsii]|uniref:Uncharacterized protein n=1 Tax=Metarhizium robertsii TaxID=568076 RepID=A0A0A1V5H6_9HYPO|nr:hypothetical protein X797_000187 [Metarhizium robertsii]
MLVIRWQTVVNSKEQKERLIHVQFDSSTICIHTRGWDHTSIHIHRESPILLPVGQVPGYSPVRLMYSAEARRLSWCLQLHIASPSWDSSEKHIILCFPTGAVGQLTVAAHLLALIILIAFAWCSSGGVRKPLTPSDRASNQNHPTNAEQDAEAPLRINRQLAPAVPDPPFFPPACAPELPPSVAASLTGSPSSPTQPTYSRQVCCCFLIRHGKTARLRDYETTRLPGYRAKGTKAHTAGLPTHETPRHIQTHHSIPGPRPHAATIVKGLLHTSTHRSRRQVESPVAPCSQVRLCSCASPTG